MDLIFLRLCYLSIFHGIDDTQTTYGSMQLSESLGTRQTKHVNMTWFMFQKEPHPHSTHSNDTHTFCVCVWMCVLCEIIVPWTAVHSILLGCDILEIFVNHAETCIRFNLITFSVIRRSFFFFLFVGFFLFGARYPDYFELWFYIFFPFSSSIRLSCRFVYWLISFHIFPDYSHEKSHFSRYVVVCYRGKKIAQFFLRLHTNKYRQFNDGNKFDYNHCSWCFRRKRIGAVQVHTYTHTHTFASSRI